MMQEQQKQKKNLFVRLLTSLVFWVLIGIVAGVSWGVIDPKFAVLFKPYTIDPFIHALKMLIGPIIFLTIVTGIIGLESLKKLGSIGGKTFIYFEVVSTLALIVGIGAGELFRPGHGMNLEVSALDPKSVEKYMHSNQDINSIWHILANAIPHDPISPFIHGQTLQVLFMALVLSIVLMFLKQSWRDKIVSIFSFLLTKIFFKILILLMWFSPVATFGAMAFLIGKFGFSTIWNMIFLIFVMLTACLFFIIVILGAICYFAKVNIFKLLRLISKELLMVFATSSSESVLAPVMQKLEKSGVSRGAVGLVIPTGYSFNLDCTNIYMALSVIFLAQAFNIPLSLPTYISTVLILMVTSKGAVGVTGSGFIVLAGTLSAMGNGPEAIPAVTVAVLLGIDKFMSELRACGNICGNVVACIIVALWDKQVDRAKLQDALDHPQNYQVL